MPFYLDVSQSVLKSSVGAPDSMMDHYLKMAVERSWSAGISQRMNQCVASADVFPSLKNISIVSLRQQKSPGENERLDFS